MHYFKMKVTGNMKYIAFLSNLFNTAIQKYWKYGKCF